MPFKSRSQERAAFSGALGAEMKEKAKSWASITNQKTLPEKVSKTNKTTHFSESMENIPEDRRKHYTKGKMIEHRNNSIRGKLGMNNSENDVGD